MIRVVFAEDSYLVREGLSMLLSAVDDVELVATSAHLPGLFAAVDEHRPDVVLTDIRMPPTGSDEGVRAAEQLRSTHPTSVWSCSASTSNRRPPCSCSPTAPAVARTC